MKLLQTYLLPLLIFLTYSQLTQAQRLSEDTLLGNPYYLKVIEAEEKGKKVNVYVLETLPKQEKYRMVRALYCKNNSLAFNSYNTPNSCVKWVPYDESKDRVTKVDDDGNRIEVTSDSSKTIDKDCLMEFYSKNSDSVQVDTIYVKDKTLAYSTVYAKSVCVYFKDLKHGKEVVYYELWELKGECIENKDRIKVSGSWSKGKKHGEWLYFDVNGKHVLTELYKKGKLKSSTKIGPG